MLSCGRLGTVLLVSWRIELNLLHLLPVHLLLATAVFSGESNMQCMTGLAELKLVHCFLLSRI